VLGLEHVPFELRVLDFIPAEVKELRGGTGDEEKKEESISK
jgi:hypothetical protein